VWIINNILNETKVVIFALSNTRGVQKGAFLKAFSSSGIGKFVYLC
jgi:hypothetical protein